MMYVDGITLTGEDKQKLEQKVKQFISALENSGLTINVAKTEYMACYCGCGDPLKNS